MTHTPAPWFVGDDDLLYSLNCKHYIAQVFFRDNGETGTLVPELQANAALIAAAPDLLNALRLMLDQCYDTERDDAIADAVSKARAAIAKAGGVA